MDYLGYFGVSVRVFLKSINFVGEECWILGKRWERGEERGFRIINKKLNIRVIFVS